MKVTIHGKPTFTVRLTRSLVDRLIGIAKVHYDAACRRTGCPGGFLYGFQVHFELDPDAQTIDETLSWRDVDTLLKVLEVRHYLPNTNQAVEDLNRSLHCAMQRARDLNWKLDCFPDQTTIY
jgi:hypothetical protein